MKRKKILTGMLFAAGLFLCAYPLVSSIIERRHQEEAVATYQTEVEATDTAEVKQVLEQAQRYNEMLWQTKGLIINEIQNEVLSDQSYKEQLNLLSNSIMGAIHIPKINVVLPVYHGTEEETLKNGVGHMQESSLPIGGENTHCLLTGHRGLPNSKLFTRLDELEAGDLFFLETCNEKLAYRVNQIEIIDPEDVEGLGIQAGKDLVSLITCTPYGLNTHRLVVTGERIPYTEEAEQETKTEMLSFRELLFASLPFLFLSAGVMHLIKKKKGEKSR